MVAKLYSYDDVGAPQLSGANDGSLLNILRGCLVDGYGTRTSAGWTMPFSDLPNRIGCFKPNNLDTVHFRLDDNYDYRWARASAFGAMTDANTGENEFPTLDMYGLAVNYQFTVSKCQSATVEDLQWRVLADDDWFYFFAPDTNYPAGFFFGRYDCLDDTFPNPYVITTDANTGTQTSSSCDDSFFDFSSVYPAFLNTHHNVNQVSTAYLNSNYFSDFLNPNHLTGEILMEKIDVSNRTNDRVLMGSLPNISRGSGTSLGSNFAISGTKLVLNSISFICLSTSSTTWFFEYDQDVG